MKIVRNVIFVLAAVLIVFLGVVKLVIVPNTAKIVSEQIINTVGQANGLSNDEIQYFNEKVDKEDQKTIEKIVENHMFDEEIIANATELVKEGDKDALKELAEQNLTDDEQEQVKNLYLKYEDLIESGNY